MNYKYDVSIIIVNYNGRKFLSDLFSSIKAIVTSGLKIEVIFVDNNSFDDSCHYVNILAADYCFNIKCIKSNENLGFAGGNNLGVMHSEGKYLLFLNNDTVVDENWLKRLYDEINFDLKIGIAVSKLVFRWHFIGVEFYSAAGQTIELCNRIYINGAKYYIDRRFCHDVIYDKETLRCKCYSRLFIPLLDDKDLYKINIELEKCDRETDYLIICNKKYQIQSGDLGILLKKEDFAPYSVDIIQNAGNEINEKNEGFDVGMGEIDNGQYNRKRFLKTGCGASMMIRKEDFCAVGMFDKDFFMYYEDTDLSYRIRALGKEILYVPDSLVRHVHTGSSVEGSDLFRRCVFRNKLVFAARNISKKAFLKMFIMQLISYIKYHDTLRITASFEALHLAIKN